MSGLDLTLQEMPIPGERSLFCLKIPHGWEDAFEGLRAEVGAKTNCFYHVRIEKPFRPRKTGYRSQSARARGHCDDLSEQILDPKNGKKLYKPEQVWDAMKRMTVGEGHWRTYLAADGTEQAISEADASVEEDNWLNRTIQKFADEHGFWLTEYDDTVTLPVPYRSLGGRTRAEMDALKEKA